MSCYIGGFRLPSLRAALVLISQIFILQPDETHIAAGMTDGTLSVRRRQPKAGEAAAADSPFSATNLRSGTFESFLSSVPTLGQGAVKDKIKSKAIGDADEFRVESRRTKRLKEYDRLLKNFKYAAALDSVLRSVIIHDFGIQQGDLILLNSFSKSRLPQHFP